MSERMYKGAPRPDVELSNRLREEAAGLVPVMQSLFHENGIDDAIVTSVGSAATGFAYEKSDFDYLFDRGSHKIPDLVDLIKATYYTVGPQAQQYTTHAIKAHFPETPEFSQAFRASGEFRMNFVL